MAQSKRRKLEDKIRIYIPLKDRRIYAVLYRKERIMYHNLNFAAGTKIIILK